MNITRTVEVKTKKGTVSFGVQSGSILQEALLDRGFFTFSECAGRGLCKKCAVRVLSGDAPVSEADKNAFSQKELLCGLRLSCQLPVVSDLIIELLEQSRDGYDILSAEAEKIEGIKGNNYSIAVDIGTTTVVAALLNISTQKTVAVKAFLNPQRRFGSDVISRINAAVNKKAQQQRQLICNALLNAATELCAENSIECSLVNNMVIACNTVMCHLLMGYDCKPLGVYPFTPFYKGFVNSSFYSVFDSNLFNAEVTVLPAVSAYIGADIVSGLYCTDFFSSERYNLFLDLGTNGEIALGNKNGAFVCSAAAGPAFEGGNISCGTGSISGAVCSVNVINNRVVTETINKAEITGICGTGVIELTAALLNLGIIDNTGLFDGGYFENGFLVCKGKKNIVFSQNDIRQVQLAKSAVAAGIDALFDAAKISENDISAFYISGGFGTRLNPFKASYIGIFSHCLADKAILCGNTALSGAIKYCFNKNSYSEVSKIADLCKEITLASNSVFNQKFVDHMLFDI